MADSQRRQQWFAIVFAIGLLGVAIAATVMAFGFGPQARLAPLLAAVPLVVIMLLVLVREIAALLTSDERQDGQQDPAPAEVAQVEADAQPTSPALAGAGGDEQRAAAQSAGASDSVPGVSYVRAFVSFAVLLVIFLVLGSIWAAIAYPPLHLWIVGAFRLRPAIVLSLTSGLIVWGLLEQLLNVRIFTGLW